MRKLYCLASVTVIALGLASCNKEEIDSAKGPITIIANTESGVDTKTYLSGDDSKGYTVLWSEGDEIVLSDGNKFILSDGAGTTRGVFVQDGFFHIEDGLYTAYYATYGNTLSSTQQYVAEKVITSAPMWCEIFFVKDGALPELEFTNLCGLMRLNLKGSGTVKEIKVSADQPLNGESYINPSNGCAIVKESGNKVTTLDCGLGVELSEEGTDFYISLPSGDYTGVKIEISDFFGHTVVKTMKSTSKLNIARAQITPVNLSVSGLKHNTKGALAGVFTVKDPDGVPNSGDEKKIRFSRGNLYWDGDSFEFEENQNDCGNSWSSTHVRYFYWSPNASIACDKNYSDPYDDISTYVFFTNDPYAPFNHERADKANDRFTVNGVTGEYRTLSMNEWWYLFEHHSYRWVIVDGVKGCVVAPDGGNLDSRTYYTGAELAAENLVFLPAAGKNHNGNVNFFASMGNYWASTVYIHDGSALGYEYVCFSNDNGCRIDHGYDRSNGFSVRLVTDVIADSTL